MRCDSLQHDVAYEQAQRQLAELAHLVTEEERADLFDLLYRHAKLGIEIYHIKANRFFWRIGRPRSN